MTLTAEQTAIIENVKARTDERIKELESYFATITIDAWPFVIAHGAEGEHVMTACKALGENRYNFSADGRDAAQFSRERADELPRGSMKAAESAMSWASAISSPSCSSRLARRLPIIAR